MGEGFLHQAGHCTGILGTGRLGQEAFAVIGSALLCVFLHPLHHLADHALLAPVLVTGNQLALHIHIHQGTYVEHIAKEGSRGRDASAPS